MEGNLTRMPSIREGQANLAKMFRNMRYFRRETFCFDKSGILRGTFSIQGKKRHLRRKEEFKEGKGIQGGRGI